MKAIEQRKVVGAPSSYYPPIAGLESYRRPVPGAIWSLAAILSSVKFLVRFLHGEGGEGAKRRKWAVGGGKFLRKRGCDPKMGAKVEEILRKNSLGHGSIRGTNHPEGLQTPKQGWGPPFGEGGPPPLRAG